MEWITLAAILAGPIFAVLVTRWIDNARERHERRMEVFRTLMRTRKSPTSPEHVGALNLIEIEFYKDPEVRTAWKELFQHFGTEHPHRGNEVVKSEDPLSEQQRKDQLFWKRLSDDRQRLLAKLLHAMAKKLNFTIEQLEIFEGGYVPQGAVEIETEQSIIRRFFISLAEGHTMLPVAVVNYAEQNQNDEAVPKNE